MPKSIDSDDLAGSRHCHQPDVDAAVRSSAQRHGAAGFKKLFARFANPAIERSTCVLPTSLTLILLFWQWQPITMVVWKFDTPVLAGVAIAGEFIGCPEKFDLMVSLAKAFRNEKAVKKELEGARVLLREAA